MKTEGKTGGGEATRKVGKVAQGQAKLRRFSLI
jgi:hypothetical protein